MQQTFSNCNNTSKIQQTFSNVFFMLALIRRTSFWPHLWSIFQSSTHILQITIFHMLDLCGQLSCTASTPVFLTCGFSSCLYFWFNVYLNLKWSISAFFKLPCCWTIILLSISPLTDHLCLYCYHQRYTLKKLCDNLWLFTTI